MSSFTEFQEGRITLKEAIQKGAEQQMRPILMAILGATTGLLSTAVATGIAVPKPNNHSPGWSWAVCSPQPFSFSWFCPFCTTFCRPLARNHPLQHLPSPNHIQKAREISFHFVQTLLLLALKNQEDSRDKMIGESLDERYCTKQRCEVTHEGEDRVRGCRKKIKKR